MERELWSWIGRAINDVSRSTRDPAYHTHRTATIVRVYLWAVLHDRPTSWACDPRAWPDRMRPVHLPSQSTMSRRLRTAPVRRFMDRLGRRLSGSRSRWSGWLKVIDGKPLRLAPQTQDRHATWGYGTGGHAKGYKLHLIDSGKPMPERFAVYPLNINEGRVARRLIPTLTGAGYLLADANYDDDRLYRAAAKVGHRFVAPRRRRDTRINARGNFHADHIRAATQLEMGLPWANQFSRHLLRVRTQIETTFGNLTSFFAGLDGLPPWVRGLSRVRRYVHAKLLINAARIRCIRA